MIPLYLNLLLFLKNPGEIPENEIKEHFLTKNSKKKDPEEKKTILCRECLNIITEPEEKIIINGSHTHSFANPHGLVFQIGCFGAAKGCVFDGFFSDEFTWFKGYSWKVAVCKKCGSHMGWKFNSPASGFAGLILDNLIFPF